MSVDLGHFDLTARLMAAPIAKRADITRHDINSNQHTNEEPVGLAPVDLHDRGRDDTALHEDGRGYGERGERPVGR
jgi:hypothetical protein